MVEKKGGFMHDSKIVLVKIVRNREISSGERDRYGV